MTYNVFLCESGTWRLIEKVNADAWPIPNPGEEWPVLLEGQEVRCVIEDIGHPELDGLTILSQDIFVRRPRSAT